MWFTAEPSQCLAHIDCKTPTGTNYRRRILKIIEKITHIIEAVTNGKHVVLVMRHGKHVNNILTLQAEEEVRDIGLNFKPIVGLIRGVYSSPQPRAISTALQFLTAVFGPGNKLPAINTAIELDDTASDNRISPEHMADVKKAAETTEGGICKAILENLNLAHVMVQRGLEAADLVQDQILHNSEPGVHIVVTHGGARAEVLIEAMRVRHFCIPAEIPLEDVFPEAGIAILVLDNEAKVEQVHRLWQED